jgi:hypothetical protein
VAVLLSLIGGQWLIHSLSTDSTYFSGNGEKCGEVTMSSLCFYVGSNFKMEGKMLQTVKGSVM